MLTRKKSFRASICTFLIFVMVIASVFLAVPASDAKAAVSPFYGKIPGIDRYSRICFWYGGVDQAKADILKTYDMVILEPTLKVLNVAKNQFYMESLTTNMVNEIKRGVDGIVGNDDDVIVLGYISVGEMLKTIIPGQSGHMTIQQGINLGLLPSGYSGPSGPVHGPNPWNYNSSGQYIDVENGAMPDGSYQDGYDSYRNLDVAEGYTSWGSKIKFTNQGYMPWYLDQQGATSDWITDSRYIYGGYWKKGDGVVDVNKNYGGGYINAGDPAWQKFVTFQVDRLVNDCDFDGVFLDTVDTPDPVGGAGPSVSWGPRGNFGWTAKGMVELVEKIKAVNPSKILAANRGYWYFNPEEGTSQFADRYRHAINMFITESWYYNCYINSGSKFYDENPAFIDNWNTNTASPTYRTRDNFGGFWKSYMNAEANKADGFNIAIIDFTVPSGASLDKWMNEVVVNSGYLGYDVSGATHFNLGIYQDSKNWLDSKGYAAAKLSWVHPKDTYNGFVADGDFSEWNAVTPIFNDPNAANSKGIVKIYTKFVNDKFFMMVESKNSTISMAQEQILFDYDKDGPSGWQPSWPVSPDSRIYFETISQASLFPYKGPNEVFSFDSPNSPTNRGWPVRVAQKGNKCEIEFKKDYIFGSGMEGKEIWTYFRQANFGGSSVKFTVGGTSIPTAPVISGTNVSGISQTGATITWNTDQDADSVVEYGTTTSYGSTKSSAVLEKNHSMALTGLNANTRYYYRIKSTNANGAAAPVTGSFTTLSTIPPALSISGVSVGSITSVGASIGWTTSNAANGRIDYGTTTAYGMNKTDAASVTAHNMALTGLAANTTYYYKITSVDSYNQTATYTGSFKTLSSGGGTITIDGAFEDWSGISPIATGTSTAKSLCAASDGAYLYIRLENTSTFTISTTHQLYIDTDNNGATGGNLWPDIGPDYKLIYQNQAAFNPPAIQRCSGGDTYSTTSRLTDSDAKYGGSFCEIRIPYSALGVAPGQTIKLLYRAGETGAPGFWGSPKNSTHTLR